MENSLGEKKWAKDLNRQGPIDNPGSKLEPKQVLRHLPSPSCPLPMLTRLWNPFSVVLASTGQGISQQTLHLGVLVQVSMSIVLREHRTF